MHRFSYLSMLLYHVYMYCMTHGNVVPELYYMRGFRKFCDKKFLQFRNVFLLQIFKIRKIAMIMITFTPIFSGKVAEGAKQL